MLSPLKFLQPPGKGFVCTGFQQRTCLKPALAGVPANMSQKGFLPANPVNYLFMHPATGSEDTLPLTEQPQFLKLAVTGEAAPGSFEPGGPLVSTGTGQVNREGRQG